MTATATKMAVVKAANRWQDAEEIRWTVRHWAARMGITAPQVHLREMKK